MTRLYHRSDKLSLRERYHLTYTASDFSWISIETPAYLIGLVYRLHSSSYPSCCTLISGQPVVLRVYPRLRHSTRREPDERSENILLRRITALVKPRKSHGVKLYRVVVRGTAPQQGREIYTSFSFDNDQEGNP